MCNTRTDPIGQLYIDIDEYSFSSSDIFISLRSDYSIEMQGFYAVYEIITDTDAGKLNPKLQKPSIRQQLDIDQMEKCWVDVQCRAIQESFFI